MNTIEKIGHWGEVHHPKWLDAFRIVLGIVLFYMGVQFGRNPQGLKEMIEGADLSLYSFFLVHYIIMFHLVGGILIAIGLVTRTAVLFQLPILIGAVILRSTIGSFTIYSELASTWLVLGSLILFLVVGSGPFSVDTYMKKH